MKEVPALRARAKSWESELQKMCPHTLVSEKRGYEDYSENIWRNGFRLCVICGLVERGEGPHIVRTGDDRDAYNGNLADSEFRLVKRLDFDEFDKSTIWKPLGELASKFVDQARIEKLIKRLTS